MKADSIHLNNLRNDAHFQFLTDFITIVNRIGAAQLKIEPQFNTLRALYADEDDALKKIAKSAITADLNAADRYRDEIFSGMIDANKAALKHFNNRVRQSAARLKIVFDTYGNVARKPLDEETSAIYNIVKDLGQAYAPDVETAALGGWVNELRQANETFSALMLERYDESAAKTTLVLKEVRRQIDEVYRRIIERINAAVIIEGEDGYAECVTTLHTVSKRYSDILAQQRGRRKS
jgi:hypothetical protein